MQFQDNYPLKNVTTLGIGGPAKKFVTVKSEGELIEAINHAKQMNLDYLVIGGGSNLLVSDEGVDCLVIKNEIVGIEKAKGDATIISVKSGTPLQNLVDYSIQNGLSGLQKLTGIQGTLGGAVYGNAGAYGQSISDHLVSVKALAPDNLTIQQFNNSDCQFAYRNSIFKQNKFTILEATFQLKAGDMEKMQMEVKEITWKRFVKYPPGIKCPGSFFKNIVAETLPKEVLNKIPPEKIVYGKLPAGALLEEVGAKGKSLDGIEISPKHANLFINKDGGTTKAFFELAGMYAQKVKEKFGITLEPEVQLVNLPPLN